MASPGSPGRVDWLAEGFDVAKLKIAELVSLLAANDVPVPQTRLKREEYVALFETHLEPKRAALLAERRRGLQRAMTPPGMASRGKRRKADGEAPPGAAGEPAAEEPRKRRRAEISEEQAADPPVDPLADHFSDENPFQSPPQKAPAGKAKKAPAKTPKRKRAHAGDASFAGGDVDMADADAEGSGAGTAESGSADEAAPRKRPSPARPAPAPHPAVAGLKGQPRKSLPGPGSAPRTPAQQPGPAAPSLDHFTPAVPPIVKEKYQLPKWTPDSAFATPDPARVPYVESPPQPFAFSTPAPVYVDSPIAAPHPAVTAKAPVPAPAPMAAREPVLAPRRPMEATAVRTAPVSAPPRFVPEPAPAPVPAPAPAPRPAPAPVPAPAQPVYDASFAPAPPARSGTETLARRSRPAAERLAQAQEQERAARNPVLSEFKQQQAAIPVLKEKLAGLGPQVKPAGKEVQPISTSSGSSSRPAAVLPVSPTESARRSPTGEGKRISLGPERPPKRKAAPQPEASPYRGPLAVLFAVLLGTSGFMGADWYRNTFSGYEPNLPDIPALPAVPAAAAPGWTRTNPLNRVLPSVIACPPNAVCERQKVVRCSPDHIEEKTFLQKALPADVLPFPLNQPACVLDTRKIDADRKRSRVVSWIAERAEKAAREHRGRVACGEARPASTGSGMPEREAWEAVKMAAGSGKAGSDAVSPSELEAAWENFGAVLRAQPAADGGDEGKIYFPRLSYDNGTIATSSAPIESWGCWARRIGYRVLALVAVLLGLSWFLSSFRSQRKRAEEERELVVDLQQAVINVLRGSEGAVSINQLRDYYITHVAPPRSRRGQGPFPQHDDGRYYVGSVQDVRRIWLKVRKDVEHNANVRVIDVMVAGEPHESWEWIGPRGTGTLLSAPTSPASPPPQNGYGAGQGYGVAEEPNHDAVPVPVPAQAETPRNWWYGEKRPVV